MAGPTSPGSEGPTFAPPQLPPGWIAQWDGASKKYYFVQLSTGVSQWEVPTDAAPTGGTPAPTGNEHPYGVPRQQELITHPDGSQTVRHVDGSLEPVNPPMPPDSARGLGDGPAGERGLGSMAMNLLGGKGSSGSGSGSGHGSSPLGNLAGQFLGGGHNHNNSGGGGHLGKIGGALASSLLSSGNKPDHSQSFHGGQPSGHQQNSGIAGSIMGGVANMFGGGKQPHGGNGYGYSNSDSGGGGGYSGQAPPTSYQPSGHAPSTTSTTGTPGLSYQAPQQHQHQQSHPSYSPPSGQSSHNTSYNPSASGHQSHPTYGQVPPPPAGGPPSTSYGQPSGQGHAHQGQPSYGGTYNPSAHAGGSAGSYSGAQASYHSGPPQHGQPSYGSHY